MKTTLEKLLRIPRWVFFVMLIISVGLFIKMQENARMETDLDEYMPQDHPAFVYSDKAEEWFDIKDGIIVAIEDPRGIYNSETLDTLKQMTQAFQKMEEIKRDIWLEINENLTALEKVRIINHIFFKIYGFSSNAANFYAPQNNYINHVLETKKGNPITLSILYSSLARMLDIPIYGVNLPKNFIVAYKNEYTNKEEPQNQILFYINPFNKGAILGKKEIDYFIKQQGLKPSRSYYLPCSNIETIQRLINNLIYAYDRLGYPDKIKELNQLYRILMDNSNKDG